MRTLSDTMSPMVMAITFSGLWPIIFFVFRPSAAEFIIWLAVDGLALRVVQGLDRALFLRVFPGGPADLFSPSMGIEGLRNLDERRRYFEYLCAYPRRRALYCTVVGVVKMSPAIAVALFYWQVDLPFADMAARVFCYCLVSSLFAYFAIFLEAHRHISRAVNLVHQREDWSETFRSVVLNEDVRSFRRHERWGYAGISFGMLFFQFLLLSTPHQLAVMDLAWQVTSVGFGGLLMLGTILYLSADYFNDGFQRLFEEFEGFDPTGKNRAVPLHTATALGKFEKTFNTLADRIRFYDQELTQWVFHQAEQSRYKALGEIAALIVHDLAVPLHVVDFCTSQIKENPDLARNERYLQQLISSGKRATELVDSLRAYLKNPTSDSQEVLFKEAHDNVMRLLETQFYERKFHAVHFEVESGLQELPLAMRKADLVHILYNILSNSMENLVVNDVASPRVMVRLERMTEKDLVIRLEDNGTGLSRDRFEAITSAYPSGGAKSAARDGLGLRLVRRLVERLGGSLMQTSADSLGGTALLLSVARGKEAHAT